MGMDFKRKLPIPKDIKELYPLSKQDESVKAENDRQICSVFNGNDSKFLLIIGPCSADHRDSVLEYVERLRRLQERVAERMIIIPRIYTNKPRTSGDGYMGMLHQPDPEKAPDLLKGLISIRSLYLEILHDYGFTCANELLYPENHRYLSDLLSYVAVGARSVENQQHRLVASGLDIPVGMKNPISGDLSVMMNAVRSAQHSHTFLYRGWEVLSAGNPYAHAVLRGYISADGCMRSNFDYDSLVNMVDVYAAANLSNPAIIVDCNHANSGKNPIEQIRIAKDVLESGRRNPDIGRMVKGLMIESYLEDGAQGTGEHIYGKSITDPCLGWEKTERLVLELANKLE